ncbi:MAG: hypothetical protein HY708_06955 [Ignavibacteriae bacterium]|nr:hypothetical protein [Ignavibacteriota bacterium]
MQSQIQGASIVLMGAFNPAIFHPSWFAANNLLRNEEAKAATVNLVHPDAASFKTEWLDVNVVKQRFQATTVQESYYESLRDMVVGILGLLSHTPLRFMGINRDFHFDLTSEESWHGLGHRLVPKHDWNPLLKNPGMVDLTVRGERPDDLKGHIHVIVQPSARIRYGIFVEVNDHYELKASDQEIGGADAARIILSGRWDSSMKRSLDIAQTIAGLGEQR